MDAYLDWIELSGRKIGPVFPGIDRWGNVSEEHMLSKTVLPLLRRILHEAGAEEAATYSSHSLRRGFANWASSNGWDLKELMEHVGWRDVSSALRYVDVSHAALKGKFERGLANSPPASALGTTEPNNSMQPTGGDDALAQPNERHRVPPH